jgi:hypothetical protein
LQHVGGVRTRAGVCRPASDERRQQTVTEPHGHADFAAPVAGFGPDRDTGFEDATAEMCGQPVTVRQDRCDRPRICRAEIDAAASQRVNSLFAQPHQRVAVALFPLRRRDQRYRQRRDDGDQRRGAGRRHATPEPPLDGIAQQRRCRRPQLVQRPQNRRSIPVASGPAISIDQQERDAGDPKRRPCSPCGGAQLLHLLFHER